MLKVDSKELAPSALVQAGRPRSQGKSLSYDQALISVLKYPPFTHFLNDECGEVGMTCSKCGRATSLVRRHCPACKRSQASFYILTVLLLLVIAFGGLALIGKLPWHS
jgi:hypothetical protein